MNSFSILSKLTTLVVILTALACSTSTTEAKLLRSRYMLDDMMDGPYGSGSTGERAIVTVRGARNPYDGTAPSKISIADEPHRGPLPRGVYDRLGSGYDRPMGRYPGDMGSILGGGYMGGFRGGYNGGYGGYGASSMYGAPNRIAVTGAFPIGYGSRY